MNMVHLITVLELGLFPKCGVTGLASETIDARRNRHCGSDSASTNKMAVCPRKTKDAQSYTNPGRPPNIVNRDPAEGESEKAEPVTVSPESQDRREEG